MTQRILLLSLVSLLVCAGMEAGVRDRFPGAGGEGPELVVIPAQDLLLGGDPSEEGYTPRELRRRAVLSTFAIGVTEVTNAEFCAFLNESGNVTAFGTVPAVVLDAQSGIRRHGDRFVPVQGRERHPVTRVSWQGARAYCAWLSRRTGKTYDLPTAAQWEAAARGGTSTAWPWGDADRRANHRTRANAPLAVASYPPNPYGLHDTTGNAWEWVLDCFDPEFPRYAPLHDPVRFDPRCLAPEIRGGSHRDGSDTARVASRANYWWSPQVDGIGFRVARAAAPGRRVRLVWQHAQAPAASLDVHLGDATIVRSGDDGSIDVPDGVQSIVVTDPVSGLELLRAAPGEAPAIEVPEPVRVTAMVRGARGTLAARVGDGPRGDAVTRFHRAVGALVERRPARAPLGVALPESPMRWTDAAVQGSRVTSSWIAAHPAAQLLVFDAHGNAAFREIAVPASIRPHDTIDAGTVRLEPPSTLAVDIAVPADATPSLQLHALGGAMRDAARELAALDQRDRRLFALLVLGEPYYLPAGGRARLQLPPFVSALRVAVRDSFVDGGIERDVTLGAGRAATLSAALDEVAAPAPARPLGGVVVSGARPVPGTVVVMADGPRRRETVTDAAGRFRFDDVRARPPVALLVDTRQAGAPAHHRTAVFRVQPGTDLSLQMPALDDTRAVRLAELSDSPLETCGVGDDQYPIAVAQTTPPGATYAIDVDWNAGTLIVQADTPGIYVFDVYATPFLGFTATANVQSAKPAVAQLTGPPSATVALRVAAHDGSPLFSGLELSFSPPPGVAVWLDATELDLGTSSGILLPCVNLNPLALHVNAGTAGACDGTLQLTSTQCDVWLPLDATLPCTCASAALPAAAEGRRNP